MRHRATFKNSPVPPPRNTASLRTIHACQRVIDPSTLCTHWYTLVDNNFFSLGISPGSSAQVRNFVDRVNPVKEPEKPLGHFQVFSVHAQNPTPFQLFRFVPFCSAKKFSISVFSVASVPSVLHLHAARKPTALSPSVPADRPRRSLPPHILSLLSPVQLFATLAVSPDSCGGSPLHIDPKCQSKLHPGRKFVTIKIQAQ
jgi:hypothetical protein